MATQLTKKLLREVDTDRGRRFVELTPHGVIVREPGKEGGLPVPFGAIEDLGWKLKVQADGRPPLRARRRSR